MAIPFLSDISGKSANFAGTITATSYIQSDNNLLTKAALKIMPEGRTSYEIKIGSSTDRHLDFKVGTSSANAVQALRLHYNTLNATFAGDVKGATFNSIENAASGGFPTSKDYLLAGTGDRGGGLIVNDISGARHAISAGGYDLTFSKETDDGSGTLGQDIWMRANAASAAGDVTSLEFFKNASFSGVTTIGPGTTGTPYDATTFLHVKGTTRSIVQQSSTDDAYYMFGDAAANNVAWVGYNHSTNQLSLHTSGTTYIDGNTTFAGTLTVQGAGAASYGSLSLVSSDSFIRLNTTGGTTDKQKWDIRTVSASGYEALDFRTVNDANNSFSTKLSIAHGGNATFAGDVTLAANLFSVGQNLKFHAAGTHVMNIDVNGKVYPNTHNAYDIGHSTSLAWRNIYSSGTIYGTTATFSGVGQFAGAIRITETGSAQHILIGNQDSGGTNKPGMIRSANASLEFGYGNSWSGEGGTMTTSLTIGSDSNATFAGNVTAANLFLGSSSVRISPGGSGEIGLNYNTGATGSLVWYAGGTASKFSVTNAGNATFAGTIGSGAITSTGKITGTELEGTSLDINGSATFDTNGNSGGFNTQTNSNAGSSAYVSRIWKNDESAFAEIWRNSSARSQTGGAVRSFNIYNSHDTNIWSGGTRALHLDTSQNATFAGDVTVTGDLNITGDINSTSVTNLDVDDKTITIAKGAANSAAADGAGIVVDGAGASLLYDHTGTKWEFNKPTRVTVGSSAISFEEYSNGAAIFLDGSDGDFTGSDYYNVAAYGGGSGSKLSFGYGAVEKMYMDRAGNFLTTGVIDVTGTGVSTFAGSVKVKNSLIDNTSVTSATTTTVVASISVSTYAAVFFDYVAYKSSNIRAGVVTACGDGTNVSFSETSTTDLGDTSDVTLSVDISGGNFRLLATTASSTWTIKSLIRAI